MTSINTQKENEAANNYPAILTETTLVKKGFIINYGIKSTEKMILVLVYLQALKLHAKGMARFSFLVF